jgi:tellurite resistance protein
MTDGVAQTLWVVAAIVFIALLFTHAIRGWHSGLSVSTQLKHPAQGPLAALVPIVGMLIGDHFATIFPMTGHVITLFFMLLAFGFAAWLLNFWMRGHLQFSFVHGGYLLPTVATSFIAAITTAHMGFTELAVSAFALGLFFWIVFFGLVAARLAVGPALPPALVPTQAILMAPPALAGMAWLAITGEKPGLVFTGFLAVTLIMVIIQLLWLPRYAALPYTLGVWSFTFPSAAVSLVAMHWVAVAQPAGPAFIVIFLLVFVSLIVLMNIVRSVALIVTHRRGLRLAERDLVDADNVIGTS